LFFREYTLRYAAVIFLLALFMLVTGLLVYMLWFATPQEPPRRSRAVWRESAGLVFDQNNTGGPQFDNDSESN
jgi:hypothetical protein